MSEADVRYAILSDVHANLPALEAVLADVDGRDDVDAVYHLGDLVGYAPWPNEVVELLAGRAVPGVAGNYDSTTATRYEHCGCRYEDPEQEALSHESYAWTLEHVSAETRRRLAALPFRIDPRAGYVILTAPGSGEGDGQGAAAGEAGPPGDDAPHGDTSGWRVEHVRVAYDVERAARAVEASDLPDAFAGQLRRGSA